MYNTIEIELVNDKDLSFRFVKVDDLHFYLMANKDCLNKKAITYEEYKTYKTPCLLDIFSKAVRPYFLMAGEYRIALVLELHTVNGWEICFYAPHYEESIRYLDLPMQYIKSLTFEHYVIVSILEDLNHYLNKKQKLPGADVQNFSCSWPEDF